MLRIHPIVCSCASIIVMLCAATSPSSSYAQMIVAHRGASTDAPENTLAAFDLAWQRGADAIEGDFYLTRDGRIVAIHDGTTKRTAGVNIKVADSTFAQLSQLDVGRWKGPQFAGEKIPTLTQVLATVPEGKKIFIEIKCGPEIVPKLKQQLAASTLAASQTVVISFDDSVISAVKQQIPEIKAHWLTGYEQDKVTKKWSPTLNQVLATLRRIKADGLDTQANSEVVDQNLVSQLRSSGLEFHVWTVDEPAVATHFQHLGVDSITTNRPAFIRKVISANAVESSAVGQGGR